MISKYLKQNFFFPKDLIWVQHWAGRIGPLFLGTENAGKLCKLWNTTPAALEKIYYNL